MAEIDQENPETENGGAEIGDNDIVFDCPHCGKSLCIDYRGAGLQIECTGCHEQVLVPIPDGMELSDLDLDVGEALKQLFATRKNYQKAELEIQSLKARLLNIQEALVAMQKVVSEGLD